MHVCDSKRPATLVSFSGIDGAGKSTQINALCQRLQDLGMKVKVVRFWDDVSRLKWIRESAGHKLFKGDKGVGAPEAPITRKDKNIQSWHLQKPGSSSAKWDESSPKVAIAPGR